MTDSPPKPKPTKAKAPSSSPKKSPVKVKTPAKKPPAVKVVEDKGETFCRYAPNYSCSVTSCALKCLHCGKGYCNACLWGEGGKMASLTKCASCGKIPRVLPTSKRPGWN